MCTCVCVCSCDGVWVFGFFSRVFVGSFFCFFWDRVFFLCVYLREVVGDEI